MNDALPDTFNPDSVPKRVTLGWLLEFDVNVPLNFANPLPTSAK